jgi:uncharacterized membrane protein YfcA
MQAFRRVSARRSPALAAGPEPLSARLPITAYYLLSRPLSPTRFAEVARAVGSFGLATAANYTVSGLVDWQVAAEAISGGVAGGVAGRALVDRLARGKDTLNYIFTAAIFIVAAYVLYCSGTTMLA